MLVEPSGTLYNLYNAYHMVQKKVAKKAAKRTENMKLLEGKHETPFAHIVLALVCAVDGQSSMRGVVVMACWPLQGGA